MENVTKEPLRSIESEDLGKNCRERDGAKGSELQQEEERLLKRTIMVGVEERIGEGEWRDDEDEIEEMAEVHDLVQNLTSITQPLTQTLPHTSHP